MLSPRSKNARDNASYDHLNSDHGHSRNSPDSLGYQHDLALCLSEAVSRRGSAGVTVYSHVSGVVSVALPVTLTGPLVRIQPAPPNTNEVKMACVTCESNIEIGDTVIQNNSELRTAFSGEVLAIRREGSRLLVDIQVVYQGGSVEVKTFLYSALIKQK